MFDIGFSELVLLGLLALIVLGPKRLPEAARAAGRWIARLRRFIADVKRDFDRELHSEELAELRRLKDELDETRRLIGESSSEILQGLNAQVAELSKSVQRAADQTTSTTTAISDRSALVSPPLASKPARPKPTARKSAKHKKSHGRIARVAKPRRR